MSGNTESTNVIDINFSESDSRAGEVVPGNCCRDTTVTALFMVVVGSENRKLFTDLGTQSHSALLGLWGIRISGGGGMVMVTESQTV